MTTVETLAALEGEPHATVFPGAEPKTVRLALEDGDEIAPHTHPGRDVVFYLVEGAVVLTVGDESWDLDADDIARFDGDQEISPRALEESVALVILSEQTDT